MHPAAPAALVAFFSPLTRSHRGGHKPAAVRPGDSPAAGVHLLAARERRPGPPHQTAAATGEERPCTTRSDPSYSRTIPANRPSVLCGASGSRIPLSQPKRPRSAGTRSAPPPAAAGVWRGVPGARPHPVEGGKELPFICRFEGTAQNLHAVPSARATAAPADRDDCRLASQMRRAVSRSSPPDISLPSSRMSPRKFCSQSKKRSARPPGQAVPSPPAAGACPLLLPAAAGRGGQLSIAPRRHPERAPPSTDLSFPPLIPRKTGGRPPLWPRPPTPCR